MAYTTLTFLNATYVLQYYFVLYVFSGVIAFVLTRFLYSSFDRPITRLSQLIVTYLEHRTVPLTYLTESLFDSVKDLKRLVNDGCMVSDCVIMSHHKFLFDGKEYCLHELGHLADASRIGHGDHHNRVDTYDDILRIVNNLGYMVLKTRTSTLVFKNSQKLVYRDKNYERIIGHVIKTLWKGYFLSPFFSNEKVIIIDTDTDSASIGTVEFLHVRNMLGRLIKMNHDYIYDSSRRLMVDEITADRMPGHHQFDLDLLTKYLNHIFKLDPDYAMNKIIVYLEQSIESRKKSKGVTETHIPGLQNGINAALIEDIVGKVTPFNKVLNEMAETKFQIFSVKDTLSKTEYDHDLFESQPVNRNYLNEIDNNSIIPIDKLLKVDEIFPGTDPCIQLHPEIIRNRVIKNRGLHWLERAIVDCLYMNERPNIKIQNFDAFKDMNQIIKVLRTFIRERKLEYDALVKLGFFEVDINNTLRRKWVFELLQEKYNQPSPILIRTNNYTTIMDSNNLLNLYLIPDRHNFLRVLVNSGVNKAVCFNCMFSTFGNTRMFEILYEGAIYYNEFINLLEDIHQVDSDFNPFIKILEYLPNWCHDADYLNKIAGNFTEMKGRKIGKKKPNVLYLIHESDIAHVAHANDLLDKIEFTNVDHIAWSSEFKIT